jgi:hypothetical protein
MHIPFLRHMPESTGFVFFIRFFAAKRAKILNKIEINESKLRPCTLIKSWRPDVKKTFSGLGCPVINNTFSFFLSRKVFFIFHRNDAKLIRNDAKQRGFSTHLAPLRNPGVLALKKLLPVSVLIPSSPSILQDNEKEWRGCGISQPSDCF